MTTTATVLAYASNVERRIAKAIVRDALAAGYTVSVNDGEEWTVKRSDDAATILTAMNSTEMDTLRLYNPLTEKAIGSIVLVWGGEEDLVSDHSSNETMDAFIEKGRYY